MSSGTGVSNAFLGEIFFVGLIGLILPSRKRLSQRRSTLNYEFDVSGRLAVGAQLAKLDVGGNEAFLKEGPDLP